MSLPHPSMSFSPFAILTAEELNDMVENIEALADGSGFDDDSIPGSALAAENEEFIPLIPVSALGYASDSVGDWLTIGNLTVPSWATKLRVQSNIVRLYTVTTTSTFRIRTKVGTVTGNWLTPVSSADGNSGTRSASWADQLGSISTGAQSLVIEAQRTSGTGSMRVDQNSLLSFLVTYLP